MNKILTISLLITAFALICILDTVIFTTFKFSILKFALGLVIIFNFKKIHKYLNN